MPTIPRKSVVPLDQQRKLTGNALAQEFHPEVQNMLAYLSERDAVPKVLVDRLYGNDGTYDFRNKTIKLAPYTGPSTLPHELDHATSGELSRDYHGNRYSQQYDQYRDAYEKMVWKPLSMVESVAEASFKRRSPPQELLRKLAPVGFEPHKYRHKEGELEAWAFGNAVAPEDSDGRSPDHLDSTLATERAILVDLARRASKKEAPPPSAAMQRLLSILSR